MDARPAGAGVISAQLTLDLGRPGIATLDVGRARAGCLGRFHGHRPAGLCWIVGMELKLYDTLTREKRVFAPIDPQRVRMYVCGPTVYDFAHIGNGRPVIVFDVLFRLLRHLARERVWDGGKGDTTVTYVRNITDVDDKINARAAEEY